MKTPEDKLAEIRKKNIRRRWKQRWKTRRANQPKPPKGVWSTKADKWTFERVMQEYKSVFDDIVDLVIATCRSQTKQTHPDKALDYLSKRILYTTPYIANARFIDREDIESELKYVWWMCYRRCVAKGWSYRSNLIKYSSYFLPQYIKAHIAPVYKTNTDEISYDLHLVESFNIDLDYVINGSDVWPASLFDQKERYLIFLLQEHPGAYAKVANKMCVSRQEVWNMVNEIRSRITEELDLNASQNTAGPSKRRSLVSA